MNQTFYLLEFQDLLESLPPESREKFLQLYVGRIKSPLLAVGLTIFCGWLGINRFYVGARLLGVFKLLALLSCLILLIFHLLYMDNPLLSLCLLITTVGVCGWNNVELFLIGNAALKKNLEIAHEIRASLAVSTVWHEG